MNTARDLARVDPWQESAERSRARRSRSRPSAPAPDRRRTSRPRESSPRPRRRRTPDGRTDSHTLLDALFSLLAWCERVAGTRSRLGVLGPRGVAALILLAAIVASTIADGGPDSAPTAARADASRAALVSSPASASRAPAQPAASQPAGWAACPLAVSPQGYVNPLAGAVVMPERIDQGVDYAGSGTLSAIGSARITDLATENSGWPGTFIEYQLLDGADAGCYVFYAEGVIPADGLHVGETVTAGQPLATIIPKYPTGIEIGWGGGTSTKAYAKVAGQWSATDDQDNVASPAGKSFSDLIGALGGPRGKVEG